MHTRQATWRGHIDSIQRGTGARFALLPPENATGNFVKVIQRVPVKIIFDETPEKLRLISPGMSVEVRAEAKANPMIPPARSLYWQLLICRWNGCMWGVLRGSRLPCAADDTS